MRDLLKGYRCVLPDSRLRKLMGAAGPGAAIWEDPRMVQPASIDLRVTGTVWSVAGYPSSADGFMPEQFIAENGSNPHSLHASPLQLYPGVAYLVEMTPTFHLPKGVSGFANPKSSAGRIALHCVVIAEGAQQFNVVPDNFAGKLFLFIIPEVFPVVLHKDTALTQLRLYEGERKTVPVSVLKRIHAAKNLILNANPTYTDDTDDEDGILLHLNLDRNPLSGPQGYYPVNAASVLTGRPIDLSLRGALNPRDFFTEKGRGKKVYLEPGQFMLALTKERLYFPPDMCGEMGFFNAGRGFFKAHDAGFFDPAFEDYAVLEITNLSRGSIIFKDGQPICSMVYQGLTDLVEHGYGQTIAPEQSNYADSNNASLLPKYFRKMRDLVSDSIEAQMEAQERRSWE